MVAYQKYGIPLPVDTQIQVIREKDEDPFSMATLPSFPRPNTLKWG